MAIYNYTNHAALAAFNISGVKFTSSHDIVEWPLVNFNFAELTADGEMCIDNLYPERTLGANDSDDRPATAEYEPKHHCLSNIMPIIMHLGIPQYINRKIALWRTPYSPS